MTNTTPSLRRRSLLATTALGLGVSGLVAETPAPPSPNSTNVLMIIVDDFSASLMSSINKNSPVQTPNMDRLAGRGTLFTRAYNDAPTCCPSRTALLTGVHAARSGVYFNNQAYRRSKTFISGVTTLPKQFLDHGYLTAGFGKITHNRFIEDDISDYTPGYYKMFDRENDVTHTEKKLYAQAMQGTGRRLPSSAVKNIGMLSDDWDRDDPTKIQQDTEQANRTIRLLEEKHDRPFFLACGFWRPHASWVVPKRYFDKYPLESIQIPPGYLANDLDDVPAPGRWLATHRKEHEKIVAADEWKACLQGYYASISYIDEQIGRVLDALEKSPARDRTIVVFFADNGYHLGEKDHWTKYALWEQTCHVPFAISVPGFPRQVVNTPVSLIDLYPTLNRLCGFREPATHQLDGISLVPVLEGKAPGRGEPVLSTYGRGNHSLRNEEYRYIRYRNGDEELYDQKADPYEWKNLAADPALAEIKKEFARWLPKVDARDIEIEAPSAADKDGRSSFPDEAFQSEGKEQ